LGTSSSWDSRSGSRKGYQWLKICWVTLNCEGMSTTSSLETELSSRTKEVSKSRLSSGSERGSTPSWWETSSWEDSLVLVPTFHFIMNQENER
jgi:hypothetical protein